MDKNKKKIPYEGCCGSQRDIGAPYMTYNSGATQEAVTLLGVERTGRYRVIEQQLMRFKQAANTPLSDPEHVDTAPPLLFKALTYKLVPLELLPAEKPPRELDAPIPAMRAVSEGITLSVLKET